MIAEVSIYRDGRILIKSPKEMKALLKATPGSRPVWNRASGMPEFVGWSFPATPGMASTLLSELSEYLDWSECPEFEKLLMQAEKAAELSQVHDASYDLTPIEWKYKPHWRHQLAAYHYSSQMPSALLNMGMGTGKTRVVFDVIHNKQYKKILVVCPKAVIPTWSAEAEKWSVSPVDVMHPVGSVAVRAKMAGNFIEAQDGDAKIIVVNYEAAWRKQFAKLIMDTDWDLIVLDEIHRIKAAGSKVSRFFARVKCAHKLGLSGTPLAHSPMDAYGIFRFLDPGIFGTSVGKFRDRYCIMQGYFLIGFRNLEEFKLKFHSITFTAPRDVLDLPDVNHVERVFELTGRAAKVYQEVRDDFVSELDSGLVTAANALTRLLRLQQVTSGFIKLDDAEDLKELHELKVDIVKQIAGDLPDDEPVVVFTRFRRDITKLVESLDPHGGCSELSGKANTLQEWKDGKTRFIVVQIQSGSEGIDLTRACHCIYYSLSFSLAQFEQSLARVHRPGQDRTVWYYHLIAERTVDRRVYSLLKQRKKVIQSIVERVVEV